MHVLQFKIRRKEGKDKLEMGSNVIDSTVEEIVSTAQLPSTSGELQLTIQVPSWHLLTSLVPSSHRLSYLGVAPGEGREGEGGGGGVGGGEGRRLFSAGPAWMRAVVGGRGERGGGEGTLAGGGLNDVVARTPSLAPGHLHSM
jgi:hypothetical protein